LNGGLYARRSSFAPSGLRSLRFRVEPRRGNYPHEPVCCVQTGPVTSCRLGLQGIRFAEARSVLPNPLRKRVDGQSIPDAGPVGSSLADLAVPTWALSLSEGAVTPAD